MYVMRMNCLSAKARERSSAKEGTNLAKAGASSDDILYFTLEGIDGDEGLHLQSVLEVVPRLGPKEGQA